MKPIIILDGGSALDREFHEESHVLNKTYSAAIAANGGIPLFVTDKTQVENYAKLGDALILTGSQAFTPDPKELNQLFEKESQRFEFTKSLYEAFKKEKKPILGICLGFQSINVLEEGTLKKNFKFEEGVEHMMTKHLVKVSHDSILYPLFGEEFMINSRHNIRADILGNDLIPTAYSLDGVLEAFEHRSLPIYGLEWHPERMRGDFKEPPEGPCFDSFFSWFIKECQK